ALLRAAPRRGLPSAIAGVGHPANPSWHEWASDAAPHPAPQRRIWGAAPRRNPNKIDTSSRSAVNEHHLHLLVVAPPEWHRRQDRGLRLAPARALMSSVRLSSSAVATHATATVSTLRFWRELADQRPFAVLQLDHVDRL